VSIGLRGEYRENIEIMEECMPVEIKEMETPMLSIIVPTYNRPKYLRACLESITVQTSRDFEVVVVCNGAVEETYDVVNEFKARLPALKIVRIEENVWSWDDFGIFFREVHKPGLEASSGEFVLFLSDDDALSNGFVERVLQIFSVNPECVGVTGSCINRDLVTGREYPSLSARNATRRPALEDGKSLALRALSSKGADRQDLADPGFGYVVKASLYRDERLQDAIWMGYEMEQIQFLLPQGLVGFDFEATFFWGRHPEQANKLLNQNIGMLRYYLVVERSGEEQSLQFWHSEFGPEWAKRLDKVYQERRFPRYLRYIWQASPLTLHVMTDVREIIRHPREVKKVLKTDAREPLFWVSMPYVLSRFFVALCRRALTLI